MERVEGLKYTSNQVCVSGRNRQKRRDQCTGRLGNAVEENKLNSAATTTSKSRQARQRQREMEETKRKGNVRGWDREGPRGEADSEV
jgi:hypothetical protein